MFIVIGTTNQPDEVDRNGPRMLETSTRKYSEMYRTFEMSTMTKSGNNLNSATLIILEGNVKGQRNRGREKRSWEKGGWGKCLEMLDEVVYRRSIKAATSRNREGKELHSAYKCHSFDTH